MKRNKIVFASLVLLLGMVVTGCGEKPTSSSTNSTENPTTSNVPSSSVETPTTSNVPSSTVTPTTSNEPDPSTNTPSTSEEHKPLTASEVLRYLANLSEFGVNGNLNSKYSRVDDDTKKGEESLASKVYVSSEEYYVRGSYANGVDALKYHYFKDKDAHLVKKTVDAKNQVKEEIMTKQNDSTPLNFDDVIGNPFIYLKDSDFVESTLNTATFNLTREVGSTTTGNLIYNILTGYDVPAAQMVLTFDEGKNIAKIQIIGAEFEKTTGRYDYKYTYNYDGDFMSKLALGVPTYPYKSTEDMSKLQSALNLIKAHNYEMKLYSSFVNDGLTPNLSAIVTPEGFVVKDETSEDALPYGMINVDGARAIIQVETDASTGKKKAVGTEKEVANSSVEEYYPQAEYSVDLFSKTEKGYVLQDAYQEVSKLIPDANTVDITYMFGVNVLTFDVADDLSTITYTYIFKGFNGYGTRKVVMTNLGTTKLPFDIATDYVKYSKATSWAELDPTTKKEADEYLGADLDKILPFISADNTTMYAYSDFVEIRIECDSEETANDMMSSYYFDLVFTYGYTDDGDDSFVKDETYRVDLEVDMFTNEFVITISLE